MSQMAEKRGRQERGQGSKTIPGGQAVNRPKRHYTTNQVARLCGLSHRTVAKLFDAVIIKGYRLPGSGFRRIPEKGLLEFLAILGMPITNEETVGGRSWLHCWEYRDLKGTNRDRCEHCEVRPSYARYCWRLARFPLPVCLYGNKGCEGCDYFHWAQQLPPPDLAAGPATEVAGR